MGYELYDYKEYDDLFDSLFVAVLCECVNAQGRLGV